MTLSEALAHVFDNGQRIQRRLWSRSVFVALDSAILCIKGFSHSGPDDGKFHPWTISEDDYYATDWEILDS